MLRKNFNALKLYPFVQKLKSGKISVRLKIRIKKNESNLCTGIVLDNEKQWKSGRVHYHALSKQYNDMLIQLQVDLMECFNLLNTTCKEVTPKLVKDSYKGSTQVMQSVLSLVCAYRDKKLAEPASDSTYRKVKRYVIDFESYLEKERIKTITPDDFTVKLARNFYDFCRSIPNDEKVAKNKVNFVKAALEYAKNEKEVIKSHKLESLTIKISHKKPNVVFLFEEERMRLHNKEFHQERLNDERDVFLFQCYTGLSNIDVQRFDYHKHTFLQKGIRWISFDDGRKKTNEYIGIPLFRQAMAILEKYDFVLPCKNLGKRNEYLKEIAVLCGIDKNLTTHVARKTFGVYLLNEEGVSLPVVSRLLSHSKLETTLSWYAPILTSKILKEVGHLL